MDGWEIAFLVLISILGGIILVVLLLAFKSKFLELIPIDSVACTILLLICALIPMLYFSGGFFTDTINQSWNYSQASLVGLGAVFFTMIFGSTRFADFSKKIVGWLPNFRMPDPTDPAKTIWSFYTKSAEGKDVLSWWQLIKLTGIWGLLIGGIVLLGPVISSLVGGAQWGEGITLGLAVPLVLILLAGNGLLGKFSIATGGAMKGGSTLSINPYPEGLCDVPGFGWASNPVAPASVILTQTIAWYYLIKNWDTGNSSNSIALGTSSAVIFLLQWYALNLKGCLESYSSGSWSPLIGYLISMGIAGAGYEVIKHLPTSSSGIPSGGGTPPKPSPNGPICVNGTVMAPDGTCVKPIGPGGSKFVIPIAVGGEQKTSEPVDDQDAFVCEAYKDGELVTSTIVD
jgi:hypothetical protein